MNKQKKGFTTIELIVTISILVIITTAIFIKYPAFRQSISLKRTAQEIALTIRQAQVYGLSVKEFQPGTSIFSGYGVHFESGTDSFILFADIDNDKTYDVGDGCGGTNTECVQMFQIQTGDKISGLCANGICSANKMDIVFYLTNPPVSITTDTGGTLPFGSSYAGVVISSLQGQTKTVNVLASGQIAVQ